jgi:assimilatory nitrate reductase catalytic subunit
MSSAVAGHRRAFGEDIVPGIYEDFEQADLMVLVGSNTAWCHPVLFQRIEAARAKRPEMRVVVIDPRRTATCEGADLHLAIAPGTDVMLFAGLLRHLHKGGFGDKAFAKNLDDIEDAVAMGGTPAEVAAVCGVTLPDLRKFYDWFARTPRTVTFFSQGVNQSSSGVDKVNAILNVHLLTGRIGKPGAGPFSITGQPNAMGGREVGALSNLLAAHLEFGRPADLQLLRSFWGAPHLATSPGLKAVSLFEAVAEKQVRAVWIIGTNPAVSMPNAGRVREALAGCDLVVVSDCVAESDTAAFAHVRLPALAWGEKEGTVTNSERVISRQRAFLPPPGEAKPDWWAVAQVAARLGHGAAFAWQSAADVFREHAALSATGNDGARLFDIGALAGLSDAEYAAMQPERWPRPAKTIPRSRLYGDGQFSTPSGRAHMVPTPPRGPAHAPSPQFPLALMTGRVRDQWHTMTRTGKAARLFRHIGEPFLLVHPDDAAGLAEGGLALVESAWGQGVLRVRLDYGMRRGAVFAPMHWTAQFCAAGRVNGAVNPAVDPVSGQPEFKHTPVRIGLARMGWHGFVLARRRLDIAASWSATIPLDGGVWRHELAGQGAPEEAHAGLVAELGGPEGWLGFRDPASAVFRAARVLAGRLEACVFMGPDHALPPRDWLMSLFAQDQLEPGERRALLAGRRADGAAPEPPVCVCMGVGAGAIRAAITGGCGDVAAVGAATKAGTNCGSCKPEIAAILASMRVADPV